MSDLKLTDVKWREFKMGDVFEIFTGSLISNPTSGMVPRITATDVNNGVAMFTSRFENRARYFSNFISISFLGSVFYHKGTVSLDMKIHGIKPKGYELNPERALFLVPLIRNFSFKYSYGYQLSTRILVNQKLMLPIDSFDQPDWQFMEDYIKQEKKKQALKLRGYYENKFYQLAGDLAGLKEVEWKEFPISQFFEFRRGNQSNMGDLIDGDTPLISAKKIDNGLKSFVLKEEKKIFPKHILTLNNDGDGGVGLSYYQPFKTMLDTHVTALIPKIEIDKNTLLFLSRLISQQRGKFSHGYSLNSSRLNAQKIVLPVDENQQPNWQYMSNFVKKIELDKIEKILSNIYIYIYRKIRVLTDLQLNNRDWKPYILEQVCEILSGQDIYQQDRIVGKTPYLTSTENNNGIGYFVSNSNKTLASKCISINRNGSVGEAFYHEYLALYGNDTRKLIPRHEDKYSSLFITQVLRKQKNKYGYGYKMGTKRLKSQKIMLPVDSYKEIDYQFMSHYMKLQEFVKIYHILNKLTFKGD